MAHDVAHDWQQSELFRWADYPREQHAAIIRCRYQAERLTRCSLCGKKRQVWGVLMHPALKQVEPPAGLAPRPYSLCVAHRHLGAEEIGQALYGATWGATGPAVVPGG